MSQTILDQCEIKGLRMTNQRRVIAEIIENTFDHPDVEELYNRASAIDDSISIATVYRTVKLFEESGILDKLEFGDGRARYENADREHHDHLIDINSGKVIEFVDNEIEKLQELIALRLGYELRGHKLELYGVPIKKTSQIYSNNSFNIHCISVGATIRLRRLKQPFLKVKYVYYK